MGFEPVKAVCSKISVGTGLPRVFSDGDGIPILL
jgi:hypothetical protein